MASNTFQVGDTVSINEGTVTDAYGDGEVYVKFESVYGDKTTRTFRADQLTLVKAVVPPAPKPSTVIEYGFFKDRYVVGKDGELRYVNRRTGNVDKDPTAKWADLDHRNETVTVIG